MSVATGAFQPILEKLAALLGDEYKLFKGVHRGIISLSDEVRTIHKFLQTKSLEENTDPQDQEWMTEVRELSYDIEDIIDEFMVLVDDECSKSHGFISTCMDLLSNFMKMNTQRHIAKAIEDLKRQVKEVGERNASYRNRETISKASSATVDPRALAIFKHSSELVGIDGPKNEVIEKLARNNGSPPMQQQRKVVSIFGFGGLGKTTVAHQVYQELRENFDCSAFLTVSRNPDMMRVLRTILSKVTPRGYHRPDGEDVQQLIMEISSYLSDKRYCSCLFLYSIDFPSQVR